MPLPAFCRAVLVVLLAALPAFAGPVSEVPPLNPSVTPVGTGAVGSAAAAGSALQLPAPGAGLPLTPSVLPTLTPAPKAAVSQVQTVPAPPPASVQTPPSVRDVRPAAAKVLPGEKAEPSSPVPVTVREQLKSVSEKTGAAVESLRAPGGGSDADAEKAGARTGALFDASKPAPADDAAVLASVNEAYYPQAPQALTAASFQRRLGREFDHVSADPGAGAGVLASPDAADRAREVLAFARAVLRLSETLPGKRDARALIVPFLSDAEPLYMGLRALEGPKVDGSVRMAYVNRLALKTDAEKLAQAGSAPVEIPGDSGAFNDWLRDSEVYQRLSSERPVARSLEQAARRAAAAGELEVVHGGRVVGVLRDSSQGLVFERFETISPFVLSAQGLAVLRKGEPVGVLIDPDGKGLVLQEGLMAEASLDARHGVSGSYDAPRREQWDRAHAAFLDAFTRRLSGILKESPDSPFIRQALRLYDAMGFGERDVLFVDTGFKGTIPTLFAALHRLRTGRAAGTYLYSARRGYEQSVAALRPGGEHRLLERAPKFGKMGGFGSDGHSLIAPTSAAEQEGARALAALIVRGAADASSSPLDILGELGTAKSARPGAFRELAERLLPHIAKPSGNALKGKEAYARGRADEIVRLQKAFKDGLLAGARAQLKLQGLKESEVVSHGTTLKGFLGMLLSGRIEATSSYRGMSGESAHVWGAYGAETGASYGGTRGVSQGQPGVVVLVHSAKDPIRVVHGDTLTRAPTPAEDFVAVVISDGERTVVLDREAVRRLAASAEEWKTSSVAAAHKGNARPFFEWEKMRDRLEPDYFKGP